ncbi:MAG: hypothetical protein WAQ98_11105 [Blastocatellia bacterium]
MENKTDKQDLILFSAVQITEPLLFCFPGSDSSFNSVMLEAGDWLMVDHNNLICGWQQSYFDQTFAIVFEVEEKEKPLVSKENNLPQFINNRWVFAVKLDTQYIC